MLRGLSYLALVLLAPLDVVANQRHNVTHVVSHNASGWVNHGGFWINFDDAATCTGVPPASPWLTSQPTIEWLRRQHIVLFGDSRTRSEYMNLAHLLLHGRPPSWEMGERAGASAVGSAAGVNDGPPDKKKDYDGYFEWWFRAWERLLTSDQGSEFCECSRRGVQLGPNATEEERVAAGEAGFLENRYTTLRNGAGAVTFLWWPSQGSPLHGLWHPVKHGTPARAVHHKDGWEFYENDTAVGDLQMMEEMVMHLKPRPTHVVFGSRWRPVPEKVSSRLFAYGQARREACGGPHFVWKTDLWRAREDPRLLPRGYMGSEQRKVTNPHGARSAEELRQMADAQAHGWLLRDHYKATEALPPACWLDELHVKEELVTHLNEDLLRELWKADDGHRDPDAVGTSTAAVSSHEGRHEHSHGCTAVKATVPASPNHHAHAHTHDAE